MALPGAVPGGLAASIFHVLAPAEWEEVELSVTGYELAGTGEERLSGTHIRHVYAILGPPVSVGVVAGEFFNRVRGWMR